MTDPRYFRLRCTFTKQGRLAMLSHLELAHALERAVRRSGLPFAVSEGFSPHMRIAFGSALPVGIGGTEEIFDLLLKEYVAPQKALALLQENSVPDMMVLSATYIEHTQKAASVAFPVATYEAVLSEAVQEFLLPETITIVRKDKEKQLCVADFLAGEPQLDGAKFRFTLESKNTGSLRPDVFARACFESSSARVTSITRIEQRAQR